MWFGTLESWFCSRHAGACWHWTGAVKQGIPPSAVLVSADARWTDQPPCRARQACSGPKHAHRLLSCMCQNHIRVVMYQISLMRRTAWGRCVEQTCKP